MSKTKKVAACALLAMTACEPETPAACEPAPGTICTIVGTGRAGLAGDDGLAREAELYLPMDSTIGPNGDLYVVDWNNHRIRVVSDPLETSVIETCAGSGRLGDGPPGPVLEADFNHPTDIVFDGSGHMWIAAWHNSRVRMVDLETDTLSDVAGTGGRNYFGDGGPASSAVLDLPAGLDFDAAGNLYFVDQANQVIRRITTTGTIERVAGMCVTNECADGETPVACPGGSGRTHCGADVSACDLPCARAYGGDGGPALEARFAMPFGQSAEPSGRIAIAGDGTIYFADSHNHRVRVISPDGMIDTLAGTGTRGYAGDGGPASAAQLDNPVDVELSEDERTLYLTDTFNHCVRAIDLDAGTIDGVAGRCGTRGFEGDGGDPREALLDRPYGIEIDHATGNLYVTDTHNHRVRVIVPAT
ncbi:hypothetical protein [Sandaracinus amylolyticus]|nr:hypothetical protein [Sandaracinus amylolyticus]